MTVELVKILAVSQGCARIEIFFGHPRACGFISEKNLPRMQYFRMEIPYEFVGVLM